jgi:hypothetical protein
MATAPAESGFELTLPDQSDATFFPWSIGMSSSKDMKLIDRCTAMPLDEFAAAFDDPTQRGRGPIMLAMIALSIKAKYPDWSVERIMRVVDDLEMPAVAFIDGSDDQGEEDKTDPLSESETEPATVRSFGSPSADSSSSVPRPSSTTSKPSEPSEETQA